MTRHHRHRRAFKSPALSRGVGLIEILIAVLVLAVGLLGIAAMQATALRNSQSSLEYSQAVMLSYSIIDAMRANRQDAMGGLYNLGPAFVCAPPAGGSLIGDDQARWVNGLRQALGNKPTTCGTIDCLVDTCTVQVRWDDSRGLLGGTAQTVTTVTRL